MQAPIKAEFVIMQWMVKWAAASINRFHVGKDGRTAWERVPRQKDEKPNRRVRRSSLVQTIE